MRVRVLAACAVAVVAFAGAAGCGVRDSHAGDRTINPSGDPGSDATTDADSGGVSPLSMIMRQITHKTDAKKSAQVVETVQTHGKTVRMSGVYAWGAHPGMDVRMPTANLGMQRLNPAPTMEMRLVDGAYYYHVTPQAAGPLKGKHWMRVDVSALLGSGSAQALDQSLQQNPTSGLRFLSAADDVTRIGAETVDGKHTTHYRGTFSFKDLARYNKLFSTGDGSVSSLLGGADSVTMDVWTDAQAMPVRFGEDFGTSKMTVDFQSFGGARTIAVPPAADTADLSAQVKANQHKSV
jgi:hypothetical protein